MRPAKLIVPIIAAVAHLITTALPATAQRCVGMAEGPRQRLVQHAALPDGLRLAQAGTGQVRFTFVGHSTFVIESPKGVKIATDYNDYIRPSVLPDIVTMNVAHNSHYTNVPDPRIRHVLRGWNPKGGAAEHELAYQDVVVRNVPTNTRDFGGSTREFGNSIFVFEIAGLCIAHLGHLHHTLTVQQLGQIGQMDVLMVPVDGGMTLDLDGMVEVLKALKAPLMIPMHMFSAYGLERFLRRVRQDFEVFESQTPTTTVSRGTLPTKQQVLVLPGR